MGGGGCFPGSSAGKESACNAGDPGSIPGWGRSPGASQATDRTGWLSTEQRQNHGTLHQGHDTWSRFSRTSNIF